MLSQVIESWVSLYANHAALRTAVEFLHIGGLVVGGGCSMLATDLLKSRGVFRLVEVAHGIDAGRSTAHIR